MMSFLSCGLTVSFKIPNMEQEKENDSRQRMVEERASIDWMNQSGSNQNSSLL